MQRYIFFIRLYAKKGKYYATGTNFSQKMLTTAVASLLILNSKFLIQKNLFAIHDIQSLRGLGHALTSEIVITLNIEL